MSRCCLPRLSPRSGNTWAFEKVYGVPLKMDQQTGKYILLVGSVIVFIGVIVYFFGDKLHWIGRLPGDIGVERENVRFYVPITTMILLSLVLTVVVNLVKRFF